MLAKLSSVRIMSEASRVTSVPPWPIATPMCASRSAGASFTPSPVIATTWPFALKARTMRSFCSAVVRALLVRGLGELRAGDRLVARVPEADLLGDRGRGELVIAGDHDGADARA